MSIRGRSGAVVRIRPPELPLLIDHRRGQENEEHRHDQDAERPDPEPHERRGLLTARVGHAVRQEPQGDGRLKVKEPETDAGRALVEKDEGPERQGPRAHDENGKRMAGEQIMLWIE